MTRRLRPVFSTLIVGASVAQLAACDAFRTIDELRALIASSLGVPAESLEVAAEEPATAPEFTDGAFDPDADAGASPEGGEQPACSPIAAGDPEEGSAAVVLPEPPPLPEVATLPEACDEAARIAAVVEACGPLAAPITDAPDLASAVARCTAGTTCRIELPAGDFAGPVALGCTILSGAGEATRIHGTVGVVADSVIARVAIHSEYGALSPAADVLVNEATLVGGYEGLSFAWDADLDVAVCRTRIAAGYSGAGQSWGSRKLTVAGSAIASCYEGVSSSWGSQDLHVQGNLIVAGASAVVVHQSRTAAIIGNTLGGVVNAVELSDAPDEPALANEDDPVEEYSLPVEQILIEGNIILGGALPASDPARDILVQML
jgi:hypothetical protein